MDRAENTLKVEVTYSPRARQVDCIALRLPIGSRVGDAVVASGLTQRHAIAPLDMVLAVWGRRAGLEQPLRDGDRIEICRALTVDPKEARRQRYKGQRKKKRPADAGR
jgi:putative ubiquitin-RnfH superfamily antitoxin RatB of RatAB toxin-antitoxin module